MNLALVIRRNLVVAGVVASLVLGGATVRAAALWTAASAPLEQPPAALSSIKHALEEERSRSAALERQLTDLTKASEDLSAALSAAQAQVNTDSSTAEVLRASLATAQAKLVQLEATLKAAESAHAATRAPGGTTLTAPVVTPEPHDD